MCPFHVATYKYYCRFFAASEFGFGAPDVFCFSDPNGCDKLKRPLLLERMDVVSCEGEQSAASTPCVRSRWLSPEAPSSAGNLEEKNTKGLPLSGVFLFVFYAVNFPCWRGEAPSVSPWPLTNGRTVPLPSPCILNLWALTCTVGCADDGGRLDVAGRLFFCRRLTGSISSWTALSGPDTHASTLCSPPFASSRRPATGS